LLAVRGEAWPGVSVGAIFIQATEIQAPCWSVPAAPFGAEILSRDFSRIDLLTFVSFRDFALREQKAPGKAPKLHQD